MKRFFYIYNIYLIFSWSNNIIQSTKNILLFWFKETSVEITEFFDLENFDEINILNDTVGSTIDNFFVSGHK